MTLDPAWRTPEHWRGRLAGARALVTGANRGIGAATAARLAEVGAEVLCHARAESEARAVAGRLGATPVWGDLSRPGDVTALARQVLARAPTLEVLVHNAGVNARSRLEEVPVEEFDEAIAVNVRAPLFLTRELLPALRAAGGARIVVVTSDRGFLHDTTSSGKQIGYRVSKAALNALTVNLASTLERDGILVNALHPGWVRTRMGGPDAPLEPADAADAVVALAALPDGGPSGLCFVDGRPVPW